MSQETGETSHPKVPFTQSVMGIKTIVMIPATLAGLVSWAGGEDVVLKAALKNILYHGYSPALRAAFAEKLEEVTGIARRAQLDEAGQPKVKKVKSTDDAGNDVEVEEPILETEQDYYNWLVAEGKIDVAKAAALMQELADTIDPKPSPSSGRKPNKDSVEAATKFLAACERGLKTPEEFITTFERLNGVSFASIGDGSFSVDNVAKAIQINEDRKKAEVGADFL